jgi:ribose 5-phosphate isomerase B
MSHKDIKIAVGADHLGADLKNILRDHLIQEGYDVTDFGGTADTPSDYPDIGGAVAERIARGEFEHAVLVCGTGAGMAISANKVPGVRAVCVADAYTAERARASNNAQVITFGSLVIGPELARRYTDIWLNAEFQSSRSGRKVNKIGQLEQKFNPAADSRHA